ncbi:hypothetical protein [Aurantiacibacter poecillastricola]|uniref:hypothetical protein n=1 Tax=Aurantiacibacter poecillastricola TaxID=3064385 RepID=UPI00273E135F|nr:hypothetical protein [Aurantiacibacter sp. 219JJ12-13]MDP5260556.1 hypothetical protein [Aurantiacibacter sp. 219JJ12-13]
MSFEFAEIARNAAADRNISNEEILALRGAGWADGRMSREEAEIVFATQQAIENPSAEWSDFFVEAIQNFVLNGSDPRGFASAEEAQWLIAQVKRDGKVCSMTELELLVRIIERAQNVPETLKTYVLGVMEQAVLEGTGPTRCGGELSDSHVSEAECKILRRVVFGQASDRPAAVSRREAEVLFRIKDKVASADNAPEFKRLFVQAVGNYLMGFAHSSGQVSRERQIELEAFIADNKPRVGHFLGRMAKDAPNAFGMVFGKKDTASSREAQVAAAGEVTDREKSWLDEQIAASGSVDEYDQALLEFIAEETGEA